MRKFILLLLIIHTAVSLPLLLEHGVLSVFPPFAESYVYQIFSDLAVSLALVFVLIYQDLKRSNRSTQPLIFLGCGTLLLGSFAPLIYLLLDKELLKS